MVRFSRLAMVCVAVLVAVGQVQAGIVVIDFDGFTSESNSAEGETFPGGTEDGITIGSIFGQLVVDGMWLGPRSGTNSIHHSYSEKAGFTLTDSTGDTFTLSGFFAGGYFRGADPLTLRGYLQDSLVGTDIFNPTNLEYTLFSPTNLAGVTMDTLEFDMGPGESGPTFIDDIVLNVNETSGAVPEPSTAISMGLLGIVGFAGNRRRRRTALNA